MKATAVEFYVKSIYGQTNLIVNGRQEISRSNASLNYGVGYGFVEVSKEDFIKEVAVNKKLCCIKTKSGKFIEVDNNNIDKFII